MSSRYTLNSTDGKAILKVIAYSGISAMIGTALVLLGDVEIPAQYMWAVPIINTALVAAKKFFEKA